MKTINTTVNRLLLLTALSSSTLLACTQTEALEKMMALSRVQQAMVIESSNDNEERELTKMLYSLNADMQNVKDNYLDKNDYSEACNQYDKIFEKYNLDLEKASKDMITIEELKKDGGKNGGSCSISEASIKMSTTMQKLQSLMENADIATEEFLEFSKKHEKLLPLLSTNPSKYCDELDLISKEYIKEK